MDHFPSFRKTLVARIGVFLVFAKLVAGCGAKVIVDEDLGGTGGAGGTSGQQSSSASTGTGIPTCDPASGVPQQFLACLTPPANGVCLDKAGAAGPIAASLDACTCLLSVDSGPSPGPTGADLCCYNATIIVVCI